MKIFQKKQKKQYIKPINLYIFVLPSNFLDKQQAWHQKCITKEMEINIGEII